MRFAIFWVVAAALLHASGESAQAQELTDPDRAVEAGAEALDRFWSYEWYDESNDRLRPIAVRPPSDSDWSSWNANWRASWSEFFQILGWTLIAVFLVVLVYLLSRAYLNREVGSATRAESAAEAERRSLLDRVEALPFEVRRSTSDLLEQARVHYRSSNFREAIIYLFSHLLVELDKAHVVRLSPGKTNRQYLAEVRRHGPAQRTLGDILQVAMIAFEDVYYGGYPLDRRRFEEVWARLDEFGERLNVIHEEQQS